MLPKMMSHTQSRLDNRKDKAELQISMERFRSYADFDANKGQLLNDLQSGSAVCRFLAAEQLSQFYPQEACCVAALAESALNLVGFEEAIAASERLLKIVPRNSLAQKLYGDCRKQKARFDKQVADGEASLLELPDEQVYHRWESIKEIPEGFWSGSNETTAKVQEMWSKIMTDDRELASILAETIHREWAVETGRVENLYMLSEGATLSLIANGITANTITSDPARSEGIREGTADVLTVETIIKDQEAVIKRLATEIGTPELNITKADLFDLQKAFTKTARFTKTAVLSADGTARKIDVLIRRGKFKNQPNFPTRPDHLVHQYCPVSEVDQEIERLLGLVKQYEEQGMPPEVLAAWLHHRFVQIHPFHDGNGRVARSLASLVLLKARLLPFTVKLRDRRKYFGTLAEADRGHLTPFVNFIVRQQKETLLSAVSCAGKRASGIIDRFQNHFVDQINYSQQDLDFFTKIQENIKKKLDGFAENSGTVTSEGMEDVMERQTYLMHGLVAPPNNAIAKKVAWTINAESRIIYCVLELHPKQWGVFVVVGVVETGGGLHTMLDGQFFPLVSPESDVAVPSLLFWMESRLLRAFDSKTN